MWFILSLVSEPVVRLRVKSLSLVTRHQFIEVVHSVCVVWLDKTVYNTLSVDSVVLDNTPSPAVHKIETSRNKELSYIKKQQHKPHRPSDNFTNSRHQQVNRLSEVRVSFNSLHVERLH